MCYSLSLQMEHKHIRHGNVYKNACSQFLNSSLLCCSRANIALRYHKLFHPQEIARRNFIVFRETLFKISLVNLMAVKLVFHLTGSILRLEFRNSEVLRRVA